MVTARLFSNEAAYLPKHGPADQQLHVHGRRSLFTCTVLVQPCEHTLSPRSVNTRHGAGPHSVIVTDDLAIRVIGGGILG